MSDNRELFERIATAATEELFRMGWLKRYGFKKKAEEECRAIIAKHIAAALAERASYVRMRCQNCNRLDCHLGVIVGLTTCGHPKMEPAEPSTQPAPAVCICGHTRKEHTERVKICTRTDCECVKFERKSEGK